MTKHRVYYHICPKCHHEEDCITQWTPGHSSDARLPWETHICSQCGLVFKQKRRWRMKVEVE